MARCLQLSEQNRKQCTQPVYMYIFTETSLLNLFILWGHFQLIGFLHFPGSFQFINHTHRVIHSLVAALEQADFIFIPAASVWSVCWHSCVGCCCPSLSQNKHHRFPVICLQPFDSSSSSHIYIPFLFQLSSIQRLRNLCECEKETMK